MYQLLHQPWDWYIVGPLIGLTIPFLLIIGNKTLGISSSFRHTCAAVFPNNIPFFKYDWKKENWNLFFVAGLLIGGYIAEVFMKNPNPISLNSQTISELQALGVQDFNNLLPRDIFNINSLFTLKGFVLFVVGGFLVGFGTRYANGCTSGHAIMGISNLQLPSLIATISFMIGGILSANFLLPLILKYL